MGFFVLVVFLLGIEVTLQFRNVPEEQRPSANNHDYLRCTVRTIEKLRGTTTTNVRFYTGDDSFNEASLIVRSLFDMKKPITVVISKAYQLDPTRMVHEKMCIAVVNSESLLRQILEMLYREIHHQYCIICVTFRLSNGIEELDRITKDIWTSGVPRNVIFIISYFKTVDARIIGVPAYSRGNCLRTKLIELFEFCSKYRSIAKDISLREKFYGPQVGHYRNGKFHVNETGLYPRLNDLGGCELSVMVQPPMLPYVERMDNSPGGMIGDMMEIMRESMNFTLIYVWSVSHEDMMNHLYSRDLNIMVDMIPRATIPTTNYRFSVGVVEVAFIVPQRYKRKMWNNLFVPFDHSIWLMIAMILGLLTLLSTMSKDKGTENVVLKTLSTLLGVGVGRIISESRWIRIFLWFWLLPAYVLVQSYLAHLTKNITVPIFIPEIRTIADLANSPLDVMCSRSMNNAVCKMTDESFKMLCGKCRIATDEEIWSDFYPNLMITGRMNESAVIANLEFLEAHPAFINVQVLEERTTRVNQLIEVRPGSGWIFQMKNIWERIFASGLLHYWRRRYIDTKKRKAATDSIGTFHSEFEWCSFALIIVGWSISFGCFIVELIIYRFVNKSKELEI